MIVGKDNYNEIIAGIYASEDKKTLVLDVFNLIGLDRSMTDEVIADELNKRIGADPLKDYSGIVENIVFNCGEYLILKRKSISVDVEKLRIAFTKLRAIACGSEIQLPNVLPIGITVVDSYIIDDLACQAEEEGLKEKAEFYYRWEAVVDYYWGNYHLGRFLQKNNQAEFEECYKKIAGGNDWFGDATSEYGVWLHKQGRYSEAIKYLMYATRALVDTSSREYALGTLCTSVLYDDCPYWKYFDDAQFVKYLIYYLEFNQTSDNSDIEKVLLQRASSEDSSIAQSAQEKRAQLVTNGSFMIDDGENGAIDILDYVKMKKAKEIFAKEIEDSNDVELILSRAYSMFNGELDEKTASLLENLLLSVECDEELCSFESEDGVGLSKVVLFWLYYDGRYEIENEGCLEAPSLLNKQKAAEILKYEFILRIDINPILMEFNGEDDFNNILESAYALYPEKDMIVRNLVEKCAVKHDVDKLVDIITQASEKLASYIALDLFGDWDYFFEYEDEEYTSENIEKILIALSEKGVHREFLLSLYQFGSAKIINSFGEYEVVLPALKSEKKASAFSNKHNVKPLSAPLEIKP